MSLVERLMEDFKTSMKNKDTVRKNTIILVRAAIKQIEIDERREVPEAEIISIISKQLKEKRTVIEEFEKGNRQDLIDTTNQEIDILLDYLPKQLSEEEVETIVIETIEELGASSMKNIGLVMTNVMPKVQGKTDGNVVSKIVKNKLT